MANKKRIEVRVMSYFRVRGNNASRWLPDHSYPVSRATLALMGSDGEANVLSSTTVGKYGKGKLDLTDIADGSYTLRVRPRVSEQGTAKASPSFLAPAGQKYSYRSIDLVLTISGQKVTAVKNKRTEDNHGSGILASGKLKIDLKPDWMRCDGSGRGGKTVDMIVIHHTGGQHIGTALNTFKTKHAPHYVLDVDGHLVKTVDGEQQSPHAGTSRWNKDTSVNDVSIGIEIVHQSGPYDPKQYEVLVPLLLELCRRHQVPKHHIIGHEDIGTTKADSKLLGRKTGDPGSEFDWSKLNAHDLGMKLNGTVVNPSQMYAGAFASGTGNARLNNQSSRAAIEELQAELERIGYSVKQTGSYDKWTQAAVKQFGLRFGSSSSSGAFVDQTTAINIKRCTSW